MRLRLTRRAAADIVDIAGYLDRYSPSAALLVRAAILDALRRLVDFPHSGRAQSLEGVRKLVVRKYPYLVYYTVDETADEVIVLTIQHPARERELDDT